MNIKKAVFPVAGFGTRFLPATKATPKEMLPIVDKPLIQYAVEEAAKIGVEEFIFITHHAKSVIDKHFKHNENLYETLIKQGKENLADSIKDIGGSNAKFISVDQGQPKGLGHAIGCANEREDFQALKSELGDLLFQVVFHAEMADEEGLFDLTDVISELNDKLIRRHPHVFSDKSAITASESLTIWEDIKAEERKNLKYDSLMDDVPKNLPSLTRAKKLQKRAARVGFDWPSSREVMAKIQEEILELEIERKADNRENISEEIGDILFTIVNLTRHFNLDPEDIMRKSNLKFENRFRAMENHAKENNVALDKMNLEELEELWQKIK